MTAYRFSFSKTRHVLLSAVVLGAFAFAGASSALAQGSDMQILLDRMERLERDIRTLNRQIARSPVDAGPTKAAPLAATPTTSPASTVEFTPGEGALSRVTVQISALEQEVRQATGQNEALSYKIDQISARLDTLITDLDYRLARLEGSAPGSFSSQPSISTAPSSASVSKVGEMAAPTEMTAAPQDGGSLGANGTYVPSASGGSLGSISKSTLDQFVKPESGGDQAQTPLTELAAPTTTSPPPATPQTAMAAPQAAPAPTQKSTPAVASILPEGSPRERYQYAFGLMSQARYDDAEAALKEFIAQHGDDPLAANARYWLGETYYVRKSFMDAAQAFFQAYKSTPDGAKAPDSLLKLGMSMASLEKTEEACATFGKLRKEFAELKPGIEKTLNRETKRLKCQ